MKCGIQRQTNAPYSPQQNGVTDCANRTIMECARSMILARKLEFEFWGQEMNTMMYIKNRCSTKALASKTPQKAWSGRKPHVFHLRVFGCKAFSHVPDEKTTKLESKSMPYVFVGNYESTKTYRLMCVETKRIIKNRDVMFIEGSKKKMWCVATLALGLQPRQGLAKVRAKSDPGNHISCSQECKKVGGNEPPHSQVNSHFGSWNPNGLPNL